MAAPVKASMDSEMCEIEGTLPTGFESMSKQEVEEKLGVIAVTDRGKVNFKIPLDQVAKIKELCSVDNLFVIIKHYHEFQFATNLDDALTQIKNVVPEADWATGLKVWAKFSDYSHYVSPQPQPLWTSQTAEKDSQEENVTEGSDMSAIRDMGDNSDAAKDTSAVRETNDDSDAAKDATSVRETSDDSDAAKDATSVQETSNDSDTKKPKIIDSSLPSFRATCYRSGGKHIFQSPQAACNFGGAVQDYFGWNVNLTKFNVEVVLIVENQHMYVGIALTKESMHHRNIVEFGPTTLRATIAYNMLRLCELKTGETVIDPMCGGGSIPLEACINWRNVHHICGDIHPKAVPRTYNNLTAVSKYYEHKQWKPLNLEIFSWDVTNLPLRDQCVDVIITDLLLRDQDLLEADRNVAIVSPSAPKSGSRNQNRHLYPKALREMARVCRYNKGRALILTQDKKCINDTLKKVSALWRRRFVMGVNIGGLSAGVHLLYRTSLPHYRHGASGDAEAAQPHNHPPSATTTTDSDKPHA